MPVNILKLCVGADSIEDLADWQASQRARWPAGRAIHVTRMFPKREAEILDGGALYWVIKGVILCRQRILGLEQITEGDGITRCALILDADIIRTEAAPRRPFQGWRYLDPNESPRDLVKGREREEPLPAALAQALAEIGLR
ncbi:MAG: DUF1489 domain-containing protein [Tabrizicola sp.]|uniref:DUF1489 family protein n=1 Tax=Tabrizicola sp. TaxID=2005166 RepID=UPI002735DD95|nr:DUF1489 domain-containing protein [Tabrizicola sp.]MDP3263071.1 DUF1489 domain-containing protein [Tabrizicola sp.]MDP3649778.1 DUF1489 domain-containing protein [Paracoccaceae bacterium]MDZ4069370.1 DUF1489 domain-containing protein [Tabrizicola sp.]